jgi:hypothetical protein
MLFEHPGDMVALAPDDGPNDFSVTAMRVEVVPALRAAGVVIGVEAVPEVDIERMG